MSAPDKTGTSPKVTAGGPCPRHRSPAHTAAQSAPSGGSAEHTECQSQREDRCRHLRAKDWAAEHAEWRAGRAERELPAVGWVEPERQWRPEDGGGWAGDGEEVATGIDHPALASLGLEGAAAVAKLTGIAEELAPMDPNRFADPCDSGSLDHRPFARSVLDGLILNPAMFGAQDAAEIHRLQPPGRNPRHRRLHRVGGRAVALGPQGGVRGCPALAAAAISAARRRQNLDPTKLPPCPWWWCRWAKAPLLREVGRLPATVATIPYASEFGAEAPVVSSLAAFAADVLAAAAATATVATPAAPLSRHYNLDHLRSSEQRGRAQATAVPRYLFQRDGELAGGLAERWLPAVPDFLQVAPPALGRTVALSPPQLQSFAAAQHEFDGTGPGKLCVQAQRRTAVVRWPGWLGCPSSLPQGKRGQCLAAAARCSLRGTQKWPSGLADVPAHSH